MALGRNVFNLQLTQFYASWTDNYLYLCLDRQLRLFQMGSLCVRHTLCLQGHTGPQGTETPPVHTHT